MEKQLVRYHLLLITELYVISLNTTSSKGTCEMDSCSALQRAIELGRHQPSRQLKKGGEYEGLGYWEDNQVLFSQAWTQLPRLHPELYEYNDEFQNRLINFNL